MVWVISLNINKLVTFLTLLKQTIKLKFIGVFEMFKLKNSAMLVVAALCGYLALMTPDWKTDLVAAAGNGYQTNLDGDLDDDVLIYRPSDGLFKMVEMETGTGNWLSKINLGNNPDTAGLAPIGMADIDGDGDADVILRNTATGQVSAMFVDSNSLGSLTTIANLNTAYTFASAGDADGDGDHDLFWYRGSDGNVVAWNMENGERVGNAVWIGKYEQLAYQPLGMGDIDGNGTDDLLWHRRDLGNVVTWRLNGVAPWTSVNWLNTFYNTEFYPVVAADTNGDGTDDLVWRRNTNGDVVIWHVSNNVRVGFNYVAGWNLNNGLIDVADVNGDGTDDLTWYRTDNGATTAWIMGNHLRTDTKSYGNFNNFEGVSVNENFHD
jgi:hypothetical protein